MKNQVRKISVDFKTEKTKNQLIRGINITDWQRFKVLSALYGLNMGKMFSVILHEFLENQKTKKGA
jgi:hypothetical protein